MHEARALGLRQAERLVRAERADLQRRNRQLEVVDRARRARPVQHEVDRAVDVDVVRDVVLDEREVAVDQVRDVGGVAGQQVVDADDRVVAIEQRFGEVRADEAGGSGDDDALFHDVLRSAAVDGSHVDVRRRTQLTRRLQSVGMLVEEAAEQREPHDLQVEAHRPVLDVVQVVLDPLLERRVAAPAVDLRPAGDARPSPCGAACTAGSCA